MSKFSVVIIDDLYGALEDTAAVLEELGLFQIKGKFTSVRDAEVYFINADEKVYIIFCDIEMPDYSGFDAIKRIRCYCSHFVFITGYADKYALKGYKVHVDGLLSKPVEASELLDLLKYLQSKAPVNSADLDLKTEPTIFLDFVDTNSELHFARKNGPPMRKHPENKRVYEKVPVALAEISYLEKIRNYIHFFALRPNDQFVLLGVLNKRMIDIEDILQQDPRFVRVDQSVFINLNYVKKVGLEGVTVGSKFLSVSKSRADELKRKLMLMDISHKS
ncbi:MULTISPECIES: LytR/AlgR family response regulator transcription factor [unclassified Sphingobacterium]|uniref:LytR/AlgR family response regulator transcription factor n=1 Tax=unclassified Sphingobacterium TaxID=2609468 RepID=UPI0025DF5F26|nr:MULTISPECIES: response regulator [unclassified Sphingobacterium]